MILGLLPNKYDGKLQSDAKVYQTLKNQIADWDIKFYDPIKDWGYFKQAAFNGKAIRQVRSTDPMADILGSVVDDLLR